MTPRRERYLRETGRWEDLVVEKLAALRDRVRCGTLATYCNYRCRCAPCRKARRRYGHPERGKAGAVCR